MVEMIAGFLAGAITVMIAISTTNRKLSKQRAFYEGRVGGMERLEQDIAFRDGRQYEAQAWASERDAMTYQITVLQNENAALREQIDSGARFSQSLEQNGSAVVYLRNTTSGRWVRQ